MAENVPNEVPSDAAADGGNAVFEGAEAEAAARRWRAFQRDRTARLEAYNEAAKVLLAARGFPVFGGGDATLSASNQANLDGTIKRACKRALLAILEDMTRIAKAVAETDEP